MTIVRFQLKNVLVLSCAAVAAMLVLALGPDQVWADEVTIEIDARGHSASRFADLKNQRNDENQVRLSPGTYVVEYVDDDVRMGPGIEHWWFRGTLVDDSYQAITKYQDYDVNLYGTPDGKPGKQRDTLRVKKECILVLWVPDEYPHDNSGYIRARVITK